MKKLTRYIVGLLVPVFMVAGLAASPAMAQDKAKDVKVVTLDAKAVKSLTSDRVWQQKAQSGPGFIYWSWKADGSVCIRTDGKTGKCADAGRWKLDGDLLCFDLEWGGLTYRGKSACFRISDKGKGFYVALKDNDNGIALFDFSVVK